MSRQFSKVVVAICLLFPVSACSSMNDARDANIRHWQQQDPRTTTCLKRDFDLDFSTASPDQALTKMKVESCVEAGWDMLSAEKTACLQKNMKPSRESWIAQGVWPDDSKVQSDISLCDMIVRNQKQQAVKDQKKQTQSVIEQSPTAKQVSHDYPDLIDKKVEYQKPLWEFLNCLDRSKAFSSLQFERGASGIQLTGLFRQQFLELDFLDLGNALKLVDATLGSYRGITPEGQYEIFVSVETACSGQL